MTYPADTDEAQTRAGIDTLQVLPVLRSMDIAGVSARKAAVWIFSTAIGFSLLIFVAGYLTLTDDFRAELVEELTVSESFAMYVLLGVASSFSLWFTYVIGRYLQSRTETQLEFIEDIKRYRTSAKHSTRLMTVLPIVTCVSVLFIMERVLGDYPFGWFGILVSGLFMLIFPLNLIFSGFLLASTYSSIRYIWHVASEVPIHLFRLASYACIAEPVMLVLGAFSVILSILGAMFMLVGEASGLRQGLELMLSLVVAIGLPFSFAVVAPVLILQRRIENVIQARRLEVVKLLEAESLGSINESSPRVTETALLARLSHLDSMSTWPVGSQLKRFALFIILPPFTWVMAATLENLMFAG